MSYWQQHMFVIVNNILANICMQTSCDDITEYKTELMRVLKLDFNTGTPSSHNNKLLLHSMNACTVYLSLCSLYWTHLSTLHYIIASLHIMYIWPITQNLTSLQNLQSVCILSYAVYKCLQLFHYGFFLYFCSLGI